MLLLSPLFFHQRHTNNILHGAGQKNEIRRRNHLSCMKNREAFFAFVRAGLWEDINDNDLPALQACDLSGANLNDNLFEGWVWGGVRKLAEEQSVLGLLSAGVEKLPNGILPLTEKLTLLGKCQMIEQRNFKMNAFVAELVQRLHEAGINAVLVKGQGIAQCYERPLWRSSGDVDLLFDKEDYEKAKEFLLPLALETGKEFEYNQHQSLTIGSFTIELHGSQRCGLSSRMDAVIDEVQREVCEKGKTRTWMNGDVPINLPAPDEYVILVFTHFLKHFYKGGLGLRQICDWCLLLWIYWETIDLSLLESRLREMRLISEWKAFAAFAVGRLGMPAEAMPLYDDSERWKRKARQIEDFVIESGNFGHNRETNHSERSYVLKKAHSMRRRINDSFHHARIFPLDSLRFMPTIMFQGLRSAARGE